MSGDGQIHEVDLRRDTDLPGDDPSRVDTKVGDFSVFTGGGFITPTLYLELWEQPTGADVVVSIRMLVNPESTIRIRGTGNPVPLLGCHHVR